MEYKEELERASRDWKENKKFMQRLKKKRPATLDRVAGDLHDEAFQTIDCLKCGNCCRTTSPLFKGKDVERLAKHLKMKPSAFTVKYLRLDEDGDYVFKGAPCPFLGDDNYCSVYESRPQACREYPHTDRKKIHQILDLTLQNTKICPAVVHVVEGIRSEFS